MQLFSYKAMLAYGKVDKKWSIMLMLFSSLLQIKAHPSVAAHMLYDLDSVNKTPTTESTLLIIDIAGYGAIGAIC